MTKRNGQLLHGVRMVWESDRYDEPLQGHAWYDGRYGKFQILNFGRRRGRARYAFYEAKGETVIRLLAQRQLFEDLVGHHSTYNAGIRNFERSEALDFEGYFGKGSERHPYRNLIGDDEEPGQFEYIGDFYAE